jgi:hypothetical protein
VSAFASLAAALNGDSTDSREVSAPRRRDDKPRPRGLSYALVDVIAASRELPDGAERRDVNRALARIHAEIRALEARLLPEYKHTVRT